MISKQKIKLINSLKDKKYRQLKKFFVVEGDKIVLDTLNTSPRLIDEIYATQDWLEKNSINNNLHRIKKVYNVTTAEIKKISSFKTTPQVVAILHIEQHETDKNKIVSELSLVLDAIQDPGNLGNIIRIADWFGIGYIICSTDSADCYNPKVVQATMGSILRVKVIYTELAEFLKSMSGIPDYKIYGTFLEGANIYNSTLSSKGAIVMGNESKGINGNLLQYINEKIHIPTFNYQLQKAESLNVAAATAIVCSEFRRRAG